MAHADGCTPAWVAWSEEQSLRALAHAYALAVDRRDTDALLELFTADGALTVLRGSAPAERYSGHARLPDVLGVLAGYDVTLHGVMAHDLAIAGARASGEVSGVAHHIRRRPGGEIVDDVLYGRYADEYARGEDGRWRFAERRLTILWTERHAVRLP